jgi:hypothetical protein
MSIWIRGAEFLRVALASLAFGAVAVAQSAPPVPPPPGAEGGRGMDFAYVGMEHSIAGKVVKGAPYSAQISTETTQTLADGTHISRQMNGQVYRDGQGRTRVEKPLPAIGPVTAAGAAPKFVVIHDPVSGSHYVLDASRKVAHSMGGHSGRFQEKISGGKRFGREGAPAQSEPLGKQTIEGVEAEGTRTTITIPAGQFGNDRPMVIVHERWYSPDLQAVVMSKHSDPRMGESVYRLTNINRAEPDASLFAVPADYTIKQGPGPMMRKHHGGQGALPPPPGDEL